MQRRFAQVNVFSPDPVSGNPVAVVLDGEGLSDEAMAAFARWTNLSETTFVLPPTDPAADYRVRIFTPGRELPFAGHPTLGTCHAWREAGGVPRSPGTIVQECGVGLVTVQERDGQLAFAAPPLVREGAVSPEDRDAVIASLRIDPARVRDLAWVDNGPGWLGVLVESADDVIALEPDFAAMEGYKVGVIGLRDGDPDAEVRAFVPSLGVPEDPVTGSLNAGLAQWLIASGTLPASYVAAQGTKLGRAGRIHVQQDGEHIWIGGDTVTTVTGTVKLAT